MSELPGSGFQLPSSAFGPHPYTAPAAAAPGYKLVGVSELANKAV
jgi:hypothetical protein